MASEQVGWAATLLSFLTRPPDPETAGRGWRKTWRQRLEALEWVLPEWLAHPHRDAFWTDGFPCADPRGVKVPTLVAGGTADVFATSVLRMAMRQPDLVKGIVGPWAHRFPHMGIPGPAIDWMTQCTRWFDHWLKGEPNGAECDPALRVFSTDSYASDERSEAERPGRWLAVAEPPFWTAAATDLTLGADGRLGGEPDSGTIQIATPQDLGTAGGEIMPMGWGADLPGDQRCDDGRSVCFETGPLSETVEALGQPALTLRIATDRTDAFCVARLCDVAPDGRSTRIAIGGRNLALTEDFAAESDIQPDKTVTLRIELGAVAHRFAKGHRIRLALSNTYWPMLWPSPRTGVLMLTTAGSALSLPGPVAGTRVWTGFGAADGDPPLRRRCLDPAAFERTIERDVARGRTALTVTDKADVELTEAHGLKTWSETSRRYLIADNRPDEARMTIDRKLGIGRGDWRASTEVSVDVSGTEDTFRWSVSLSARVGRRRLAERRFKGEIDRKRGARDST